MLASFPLPQSHPQVGRTGKVDSPEGPSSQRGWPTLTVSSPDPGREVRQDDRPCLTSVLPAAHLPPGPLLPAHPLPSAGAV